MSIFEWRYLPNRAVKHALRYAEEFTAVCGVAPNPFSRDDWHGTGSQVEYETVSELRPCLRCTAKVGAL